MTLRRTASAIAIYTFFIVLSAVAQPRVEVVNDIVNMGEVMYRTPRVATFELRNVGTEPMHITAVNPSCGCTKVAYEQGEVAAGASTRITAEYDARLLGTFQKELEVYTDGAAEPLYLTLQGRVVATMTDYSGSFPYDLGAVKLSAAEVEFDDVNLGDRPVVELQVVNVSRHSYTPQLMHLPPYIEAKYIPERLAGGRVGRIQLKLNSDQLKSYGLTQTTVYLARQPGDKVSTDNEISVSAVLLPAFAHLSAAEMAAAPHMELSEDSLDMGAMKGKKKLSRTITVRNTGQSPLIVSSVQVYGKALGVSLSNRTVEAGQTAKLKITAYQQYVATAKTMPRVLLITNDPSWPKHTIRVNVTK